MDSYWWFEKLPNPKRLKDTFVNVSYPKQNNFLHSFVLISIPDHWSSRNLNIVQETMAHFKTNVNALNDEGYTALHLAVLKNSPLMVQKLLSYFKDSIDINTKCDHDGSDSQNDDGFWNYRSTALHLAAKSGELDIIKLLVSNGANVNAKNIYELTPLHCAARSGNLEAIKFLVSNGAVITAKDEGGRTLLQCAARSGNLEAIKFFLDNGAVITAENELDTINRAVQSCSLEAIKYLVDRCVHVTFKSESDELLFCATEKSDLGVILFLIDKGADVNAKGRDNRTPLYYSIFEGRLDIAELLVGKGADVNVKDKYLLTPLHHATRLDIAKFLIEQGADVNARGTHHQTPLHCATAAGKLDIIEILIGKGADVNAQDKYSETPLHYARRTGRLNIVEFLLDKGADVNVK